MCSKWLILLNTFVFFTSLGQSREETRGAVDSLLKIISSSAKEQKKAQTFLELSEAYSFVNLDSVNFYAAQAETTATKLLNQTQSAKEQKEIKEIIAGAYNNRGFAYFNKGDFPSALKYHKNALDIWKGLQNTDGIGNSLNNLGAVYRQLGEYEDAKRFFIDALAVYEKKQDKKTLALIYNNLGGIYKMLDQDSRAIHSYRKALHLRKKSGDQRGVATTLNNIGALYKKLGVIDSASFYFNQAFILIEKVGDQIGIAHASSNMGEMALIQKNYAQASIYGEKALAIGIDLGATMIINQATGLLERVYSAQNNWKKAYEMQKLHNESSSKIKSEEARNAAMKMEVQYYYEKQKEIDDIESEKQKAIAQEKSTIQRVTIYFVSLLFILVVIFSLLIFRRYKFTLHQKKIIEKQNNEKKIMLQEIHHRVKNNFQIISSLLRLQTYKNPNTEVNLAFHEAINRIHTMSIVHEIIYKQDALDKVDPQKYLENLIENLKRSFENGKVQIDIRACEQTLELDQTVPLGIIVNELITNSYKHAFDDTIHTPQIQIVLEKMKNEFVLIYSDNGIGYTPRDHSTTFGLELIDTMVVQISGKMEFYSDEFWKTNFKITFQ
jgi:two-component system, sensor histidine kinase PdtaS